MIRTLLTRKTLFQRRRVMIPHRALTLLHKVPGPRPRLVRAAPDPFPRFLSSSHRPRLRRRHCGDAIADDNRAVGREARDDQRKPEKELPRHQDRSDCRRYRQHAKGRAKRGISARPRCMIEGGTPSTGEL